jgi:hypothetical protein
MNSRIHFLFIAFLLISHLSHALFQVKPGLIQGKITNQNGEALPFAGVSVKGTSLGTLANSDGIYELSLGSGEFIVHFQHLGFKTEQRTVQTTDAPTELNVILKEQSLSLREVQVGKESEDPAYSIMRKAIAKADYHQLQILSYSASVYARSTALPTKIPVLMHKRFKKQGISEGIAFVNESVSSVDYKRPNSYTQKIISTQNNLDNSVPTPNEFIFASFYNPEVGGTVTPLSPKALSLYKFEYEGHFEDRGEIINKIKVTPKSFKQGVFKGSIYIIEDRWAIHSFNLQTVWQGFHIQVKQLFAPSQNVWIPRSQHFDIHGNYLGFSGKFTYIVSINYNKLQIDPSLRESVSIVDLRREPDGITAPPNKQDLESLLASGQKVDTKTFRKTVKQYKKEQQKTGNSATAVREIRRDSIIVEPLANQRDSSYWASTRTVPLNRIEQTSYVVSDSIVLLRARNRSDQDSTQFKPHHLFTGATYRYGTGRSLALASPFRSLNFNPVEAFNFDFSAEWRKRKHQGMGFRVSPRIHYSSGRNRLSPFLRINFDRREGSFLLEGGEEISQFNPNNPIHPIVNTLYYLLLNKNHIRLYQKQFGRIQFQRKQLFEMADLTVEIESGRRHWLNNLETRGEFLRGKPMFSGNMNVLDYADYPSYFYDSPSSYTSLSLKLDIHPWQQYTIRNGRRRFTSNNQPVLSIYYKKGIPALGSIVDYDLLELGIRYEPKVFEASTLPMSLLGGQFFNNKALTLADLKHFMGNRTIIQLGDRLTSFRMLPYYYYSTGRNYFEGHISLNSPKLVLTQIQFLRMIGLKEYIQGHLLRTPSTGFYSEQVFGVDGILKVLRTELISHFDQDRFLGLGFRVGTIFNF